MRMAPVLLFAIERSQGILARGLPAEISTLTLLNYFQVDTMNQIIEFASNHTMLFLAFFVTLGMLLFTEYTRLFSGVSALSPYAATQMLNGGEAVFFDVREEAEFKNGHVIDAHNFPVSSLDKRLHEIEKFKDKEIVLYCESGMRTSRFAAKLRKNGFTKLHVLAGGLAAWEKANLPVVSK